MDKRELFESRINNVLFNRLNGDFLLTGSQEDADNELEEAMKELERIVNEWYSGSDFAWEKL